MNQGTFPSFYENNSFEKHKYRKRGGGGECCDRRLKKKRTLSTGERPGRESLDREGQSTDRLEATMGL